MSVPLEKNHELHGLLLGLVVASVFGFSGRDLGTSLTAGSVVGAIAVALMKTFGHPNFFLGLM